MSDENRHVHQYNEDKAVVILAARQTALAKALEHIQKWDSASVREVLSIAKDYEDYLLEGLR